MMINKNMKFLYKGTLYEEDYHRGPTSHFNLKFITQIHDLASKIGMFAFKYVRDPKYQPDVILPVTKNPNIYLLITENMHFNGADAELSNYEDGYLITIAERDVKSKDISNDVFISILHEVTHILQRENGINSDTNYDNTEISPNTYFNDPTEVNAFLMSIIAFITFSPSRARLMTKMPFQVFVDKVLSYLRTTKKDLVDHMANDKESNTQDSTRAKFYEILYLLHSKLKQGYFSELPAMGG
jgi:hypothetical protein